MTPDSSGGSSRFERFMHWAGGTVPHHVPIPGEAASQAHHTAHAAAQPAPTDEHAQEEVHISESAAQEVHIYKTPKRSRWFSIHRKSAHYRHSVRMYGALSVLVAAVLMLALLSVALQLPRFGDPAAPTINEVSQRYLEQGVEETGATNAVAGMILDYRAFDTFGESTVLFVAACSVLILLKLGEHGKDETPTPAMVEAEWDDRHHEPKNDEILQLAAKILVPIVLFYGIYVVLNGHLSPGGGFSGGAIMGAALILYLNAFGFEKASRIFTFKTFRWVTFVSLMTYAGLKSYSFFTGANHIESHIPKGTPGAILSSGFILPLNICVGLIVMCTMYAFYTLFRKGGMK